jgi:hypothetical protein
MSIDQMCVIELRFPFWEPTLFADGLGWMLLVLLLAHAASDLLLMYVGRSLLS